MLAAGSASSFAGTTNRYSDLEARLAKHDLKDVYKDDLPTPNPSIWHAYREMIPALVRQLRNEEYFVKRELPPTARAYREGIVSRRRGEAAAPYVH